MKRIRFKTLKGKVNENPDLYAMYFTNDSIRVNRSAVIFKCKSEEEFTNTVKFFYGYVCNSLHNCKQRLEIRMPKDTILDIEDVSDDFF